MHIHIFLVNCVVLCIVCVDCVVLCIVCVLLCTVLLPPGVNPIAVKYIISYIVLLLDKYSKILQNSSYIYQTLRISKVQTNPTKS